MTFLDTRKRLTHGKEKQTRSQIKSNRIVTRRTHFYQIEISQITLHFHYYVIKKTLVVGF